MKVSPLIIGRMTEFEYSIFRIPSISEPLLFYKDRMHNRM